MTRFFLVLVVTLYPLMGIGAEPFPEPFGLSWDMSDDNLKEHGFTLVEESSSEFNVFTSVSVPKAWSKGNTYLALTYKDQLVKVVALSVDITNDIYGSEGKEMYNQMKALLTKKYGAPSDHYEYTGRDLYDEIDEFYQCLEYSGCGNYVSIFKFSGGTIAIEFEGKSRGAGYLTIGYESPDFLAAKRQIAQEAKESDTDVF